MSKYKCFVSLKYKNSNDIKIDSIYGIVLDTANDDEKEFYTTDSFPEFIFKYLKDDVDIFVWGDNDTKILKNIFSLQNTIESFNYKIFDLNKEISKYIKYQRKTIKYKWSIEDVKKIYGIKNDDANDVKDMKNIYLALKNKYPLKKEMLKYFYEKSNSDKVLNYFNKTMYLDFIPGEFKYGLANLFEKSICTNINTEGLKFNKKTMIFEGYNYKRLNDNSSEEVIKLDSEIIRYSKIQMITKINYKKDIIDAYEVSIPIFSIYLTCISNKLGFEQIINTSHHITLNQRNILHVGVFLRTMKKYDKLYDINKSFSNKYNMLDSDCLKFA